jgi:hypothetical protein
MRDIRFFLKTHYAESRALVVGINKYVHASPLEYAVNDAREIRELLTEEFTFAPENITFLADEDATKQGILRAFLRFANEDVDLDDRLLVFFAGHGYTRTGSRGEIGYLVPYDADPKDFSTYIRWDELTRNAELIRAKHVLFIMDACYGGLALTRNSLGGSTRFLKDMMLRQSRQVLTAGKADQLVADSGGPLPNHSVFTGHLVEALRGKAATEGGVITASGVMAYVYGKVATDKNSNQTPHYGHFDGDGDFVFKAPGLQELESAETYDLDQLIGIPFPDEPRDEQGTNSKVRRMKTLLSADTSSIELHDFLTEEVRRFLSSTAEDSFPCSGQFSQEELQSRIAKYEELTRDLSLLMACLTHWGRPIHIPSLQKCVARSGDRLDAVGGLSSWLALRWYPLVLELYCAGISAVDAQRYDLLAALFFAPFSSSTLRENDEESFVESVSNGISDLNRSEVFKKMPGHERQYAPLSEYLYKILQPRLDDVFFFGKNYEVAFDTFEVFFGLAVADSRRLRSGDSWGPVGRFGWKHRRSNGPLARVVSEGRTKKDTWAPLKAGLFGGDFERFDAVANDFVAGVDELRWN